MTTLPTRPLRAVPPTSDWPDTASLFVDFTPPVPPTNEIPVWAGKPPAPGERPLLTWRHLGYAALAVIAALIVLVATHPLGVHLLELSGGAR